jgi:gamma-glutamyltranspeptidase/glutathione hydrolase
MNVREAVAAPRFHHQWLPDRITYERDALSGDTLGLLEKMGHKAQMAAGSQGSANAIIYNAKDDVLEGGADPRAADSAAIGR